MVQYKSKYASALCLLTEALQHDNASRKLQGFSCSPARRIPFTVPRVKTGVKIVQHDFRRKSDIQISFLDTIGTKNRDKLTVPCVLGGIVFSEVPPARGGSNTGNIRAKMETTARTHPTYCCTAPRVHLVAAVNTKTKTAVNLYEYYAAVMEVGVKG